MNERASLTRFRRRLGFCLVLLVAAVLTSSCASIFKQEEFTGDPAALGPDQATSSSEKTPETGGLVEDTGKEDAGAKASDVDQARSASVPSTATIASEKAREVEASGATTGLQEETPSGDKLLFTTQTMPPSGLLPEKMEERETWPYLTLEDAPIEVVLETFIKIMPERGTFNYIVDPAVKTKKITTRFWRPVRPDNLWFILQSILTMNGLTMVDSGRDFYKIVPLPNAKQLPIETYVGREGDHLELEDVLVTQVIPTEHIIPSTLLKLVKPFLSSVSFELANDETMLLIISDLASNIKRVMTFVKLLDVPTATEELKVYSIQYADAGDVASVLDKLFAAKSQKASAGVAPSGTSSRRTRSRSKETAAPSDSGSLGGFSEKPVIITDKRSNSLIVLGRKSALEAIETVVEMLDVNVYGAEKTYVYYLENAEAKTLASVLSSLYSKGKGKTAAGSRAVASKQDDRATPFGARVRESGGKAETLDTGTVVGDVNIVADELTNSLIIITDPINYPEIEQTIKALDIRPKQLLIEVLIAELTLDKTTQFGLEWALKGQGSANVGGEQLNVTSDIAQSLGVPSGTGFVLSAVDAARFKGLLNAYASQSKLNVLSTPSIVGSNNQEAKISVGKDVPIITSETSTGTTTIETNPYATRTIQYKETGILLDVKPHVNEKRKIKLEVSQTVSDAQSNKIGGSDSPVVNRREIKTTVFMDDRNTLLIGGLMKKSVNTTKEGIPLLMDIPWIGRFFSSTSDIVTNTELIILITPTIIDTTEDAKSVIDDLEPSMKDLFKEIRKRRGGACWEREKTKQSDENGSESDKTEPEAGASEESKSNEKTETNK